MHPADPPLTPAWKRARSAAALGVAIFTLLAGATIAARHPNRYVTSASLAVVGAPTIAQREFSTRSTIDPSLRSWLARYDNPTVVADILARVYTSRTKRDELRAAGFVGDLQVVTKTTITSDSPGHGPVVVLNVVTENPGIGVEQLDLVVDDLQRTLTAAQDGADPNLMVSAAVVTRSDQPVQLYGSRARWAVAITLLAGLLAFVVSTAMLAVERRRRPREGAHRDADHRVTIMTNS